MRIAAKRRADWLMSDLLYEGRQRSIRAAGARFEVVEVGRGEPIVLVPGLAGGWKLLTPLARSLARNHRVILFSYRDEHDPLSIHPARSVGDYALDLAGLIGELGLERPTLFGVSFGGAVALEHAVEHPNQVGRLVVSGIEAQFRTSVGSLIARRVLERFPLPADNPFVNQFFNLLHAARPGTGPITDFVVDRCWATDQTVMARRLAMLESFDVTDRLWQVDAPALVLAGARDVVVPTARQKALAAAIPGAHFVVMPDAGHVGFLTHSADFARQVTRLCQGEWASLA